MRSPAVLPCRVQPSTARLCPCDPSSVRNVSTGKLQSAVCAQVKRSDSVRQECAADDVVYIEFIRERGLGASHWQVLNFVFLFFELGFSDRGKLERLIFLKLRPKHKLHRGAGVPQGVIGGRDVR